MSLTSIYFLIMVLCGLVLYYIIPKNFRFIAILAVNLFFIFNVNSVVECGVWFLSALITYLVAISSDKAKEKGRTGKPITVIGVILVALVMILLKDLSFFKDIVKAVCKLLNIAYKDSASFFSPLGISYYSLSFIGYMLDVYWGSCKSEKNPLKFFTFAGYFPILTSGPIIKYSENKEEFFTDNSLTWENISQGFIRVVWGLMKKLIIANRLSIIVDTIYGNPYRYPGLYILIAMILFVFQLYTDFSGCIDIALGVSKMFSIKLPENFDHPFLSETLAEFWRRWHITLGGWLKDYILYPILKSSPFQKLSESGKARFGKKTGKKIPVWIGLLIAWFLIGFWHGGHMNYIVGVGLFYGVVIILSEMLEPLFGKITKALHFNTEAFSYKAFRVIRTFFIFMIGLSFFRAGTVKQCLINWKLTFTCFNPWILSDGSLYNLGLNNKEFHILFIFMMIMMVAGILSFAKKKPVSQWLMEQNVIFRYLVVLLLIYSVIIYGNYGVGFSSAAFIYQGF